MMVWGSVGSRGAILRHTWRKESIMTHGYIITTMYMYLVDGDGVGGVTCEEGGGGEGEGEDHAVAILLGS